MRWLLGVVAGLLVVGAITYSGLTVGQKLGVVGQDLESAKYKIEGIAAQLAAKRLTEAEASAVVFDYLMRRFERADPFIEMSALTRSRGQYSADYLGDGRWKVTGLGSGKKEEEPDRTYYFYKRGEWIVYEKSLIVEPANDEARDLVAHLQRSKSDATLSLSSISNWSRQQGCGVSFPPN